MTTIKCKECGNDFTTEETEPLLLRFLWHCRTCVEIVRKRDELKREQEELERKQNDWHYVCPPAFRETQIEKLPNPKMAKVVTDWEYSSRGLMLYGVTRKGKSRCAWLLIKKQFFEDRRTLVLDSMAGIEYMTKFSESASEAGAWVRRHAGCTLLFLDDVFKAKLTDSFEAALFAIIDYRVNHKLPIIATCNDTEESLTQRMSGDRGIAFIARLKEICEPIAFI